MTISFNLDGGGNRNPPQVIQHKKKGAVMANDVNKNFQKGGYGIIVVGAAQVAAELLEEVGAPAESKPYLVTLISGIIFGIINRIKHRRVK
jgi:hypothetical protein